VTTIFDSPGPPPPPEVLAAFGADGDPVRFAGGQGTTWRAGTVVLKRVDFLPETLWRAEVLDALPDHPAFRLARPVRTTTGDWTAHPAGAGDSVGPPAGDDRPAWEATRFVEGEPDPGRPDEVIEAGHAFHDAVASLERPAFLDQRHNPWTDADRIAWSELPTPAWTDPSETRHLAAPADLLRALLQARRPVELPAQAVHGDLAGNVLFADGLPPAVIDWPLYWRPTSWAAAVVVVDAVTWHGAGPDLADRQSHRPEWRQMMIRALIYRILTDPRAPAATADAYRLAATLVT
jgi:uncharacterized protein (TIGR02569 family)